VTFSFKVAGWVLLYNLYYSELNVLRNEQAKEES